MPTFRLSRSLVGIFALCYVSMSATIIAISTFSASDTSMAAGSVPAVTTPCPSPSFRTPVNRSLIQDVVGTLQSISGQNLVIAALPKGNPRTISATYSPRTRITQQSSITTNALKPGVDVSIRAIPNANNTAYTAAEVTLSQQDDQSCFDGPPPNHLSSPVAGNQPNDRRCFGNDGPGQAPGSSNANATPQSICLRGTVQQLTGTTLTVKDNRQAKSYTITLTKTTQLIQDAPATSAALKAKTFVIVTGLKTNAAITALHITVLASDVAVA